MIQRQSQAGGVQAGSRMELKYRMDTFQYLMIRNALTPYMRKDDFTRAAKGKGYFVRSLYFDTPDYDAYFEKMNGDCDRTKCRIRTYAPEDSPECRLRVELKIRSGNRVIKKSAFVTGEDYRMFRRTGRWPNDEDPVLTQFQTLVSTRGLRPQVLIEYEREGYAQRQADGVRITFDHGVRSAHAASLWEARPFFREHFPHAVVMEIKFCDQVPVWLRSLVQRYDLKVIANSKFAQGIQLVRHDLHYPDGILIIR